jgi:hypothetical protein
MRTYFFLLLLLGLANTLQAQDSLTALKRHRIRFDLVQVVWTAACFEYGYAMNQRLEWVGTLGIRRKIYHAMDGNRTFLRNQLDRPDGSSSSDVRNGVPLSNVGIFDQIISVTTGAGIRYHFFWRPKFSGFLQPALQLNYLNGVNVMDTELILDHTTSKAPDGSIVQQSLVSQNRVVEPAQRWIGGPILHIGCQFRGKRNTFDLRFTGYWNPLGGLDKGDFRQKKLGYTGSILIGWQF